jgi:Golgi casein kinase, C-terminal, Fam20
MLKLNKLRINNRDKTNPSLIRYFYRLLALVLVFFTIFLSYSYFNSKSSYISKSPSIQLPGNSTVKTDLLILDNSLINKYRYAFYAPLQNKVTTSLPVIKKIPRKKCHELHEGYFNGKPLHQIMKILEHEPIINIVPSSLPGRTIKFSLFLKSPNRAIGLRTVFKLYHRGFDFSSPSGEVGSFRLSKLLKIKSIPPSALRKLSGGYLLSLLKRFNLKEKSVIFEKKIATQKDIIWGATILWVRNASSREITLKKLAKINSNLTTESNTKLISQLSDMLILDFMTNNYDRFSGGNIISKGGNLFFIDNGAAFGKEYPWKRSWRFSTLKYLKKIRISTWNKLNKLTINDLQVCLTPLLGQKQISAIVERKEELIAHIQSLIIKHGDSIFIN